MSRPFKFKAWPKFQDQPVTHPGQSYDLEWNGGISACPVGGPVPYGRVLVRGPQAHFATLAGSGTPPFAQGGRYYTNVDACCLPDKAGLYLKTPAGVSYATATLDLPVDAAGLLIPLGIGMATEYRAIGNSVLASPFGFGDFHYQSANEGQVGIATMGRVWVYCETDMNVGDDIFFRTAGAGLASATNDLLLLGAISNVTSADVQRLTQARVFRPGPAGGACVLQLFGF